MKTSPGAISVRDAQTSQHLVKKFRPIEQPELKLRSLFIRLEINFRSTLFVIWETKTKHF